MKVDPVAQQRLGTMLFYGIVIVLAYFTYRVFQPVLVPIVWAAILVTVTHRVSAQLKSRLGRTRGAALATLGATLVLIVPALAIGDEFVQQAIQFFHTLSTASASGHLDWLNRLWQHVQERFSSFGPIDLAGTLRRYAGEAASYIAGQLGAILTHALAFVFDLFVMLITTFYLYRDGEGMLARLREVLPFRPGQRERMLEETQDLIVVSVISSGLGALLHGVLIGAAFAALGVSSAVFWGVMIAFVSFVPVFGAAIVWAPASIVLMAEGHVLRGIVLFLVSLAISTVIDYWFRPWVISGRAEMGGLAVFIGVVGGILYFGLIGIVLGPIILALTASLLDLYRGGSRHGNKLANASEG